jgi:pimeloyl-ACP methyl ester carboxylesterase
VDSGSEQATPGDGGGPVVLSGWIPPGAAGTGTAIGESFRYQVPVPYDAFGPPLPMVIAYHGYGASAGSVHPATTIDEEANARGWFYFAPTGLDDQLFGTPPCQQNVDAALQWMLDHFNIDRDRLYMVGFSMGGGVAANYVAQHRDPDRTMIAALGIVSGTYDWEQTYNIGTSGLKALMENPYNFGGNPVAKAFRYHAASDLRFLPSTYPPLPGTFDPPRAMATNLGSTPTYVVWDVNDTVPEVTKQGPLLVSTLQAANTQMHFHTVSGTVNPGNGQPATHSWAVLDEVELFDFFDGKVVDRTPADFAAQLEKTANVSWLHVEQRFAELFTYADGSADAEDGSVVVDQVSNARVVRADTGMAGLTGEGPFDVYAESANAGSFQLELTGFECPPAYLLDSGTGLLRTGTTSDPLTGTLITQVTGGTPVDLTVVCQPNWTTRLTTTPNPSTVGGALTIEIDAPDTSVVTWMVIGFTEALSPVKGGNTIAIQLGPPAMLVLFTLDANGDNSFPASIPNDGLLAGNSFLLQTLSVDGSFALDSISNLWVLKVD